MDKINVPDYLSNNLKCELCNEYLSYPPITLYADTGSVCGRCPSLEPERNIQPLRETNYEKLAGYFLLFPCRYRTQGCMENFSMEDMPSHERSCSFKPCFCPLLPLGTCPWQGTPVELHMHFNTDHPDMLMESEIFELDFSHNYKRNMLLPTLDKLFLISTEYNDETDMFYCLVNKVVCTANEKYRCIVKLNTSDGQNPMLLEEKEIYGDRQQSVENGYTINVVSLKETLNEPCTITCEVEITEFDLVDTFLEPEVEYELVESIVHAGLPKEKMLTDIECPVCQEYMVPPIYQCYTGHSICGECKPKLRDCPTCRGVLADTRNFTLEKITEYIEYPCRNYRAGCTFVEYSHKIRDHEAGCKFSPLICPLHDLLKCDWKGTTKIMIEHFKNNHPDYIMQNPLIITATYSMEELCNIQNITEAYGGLFRVYFGYNNYKNRMYGTVQYIGPPEDATKYMYEVNVTDLNKKSLQLISKKFCGTVNDKKSHIKHCTIWSLDMILLFKSEDNQIQLKYKIIKI